MNIQSVKAIEALQNTDIEQLIFLQAIADVDPPDSKPKIAGPANIVRIGDARRSIAKEFIVYFGPSETPRSEVEFRQTGKNLFDISKVTPVNDYVELTVDSGTMSIRNGDRLRSVNGLNGFSATLPSGTYTVSLSRSVSKGISVYGKTAGYIGLALPAFQTSGSFTLSAADEITLSMSVGYNEAYSLANLQIEYGTSATEYEPYREQNYTQPFGYGLEDIYGGSLNLSTGELTVTHDLVSGEIHELDEPMVFGTYKREIQLYQGGNVFYGDGDDRIRVKYTARN